VSDKSIEFLQWIYQECEIGNINLRFLGGGHIENEFVPLNSFMEWPTGIGKILEKHKDKDCFFAVALRDKSNGKKEGITQIPSLWVDLDGSPLQKISESLWQPSAVIETRPGRYHVYWKLREPSGPSEIASIENLLKRLQDYFQGDPAATDASRVLRIPGTFNYKQSLPFEVRIHSLNRWAFNLQDFDDLPEVQSSPTIATPRNEDHLKKIMGCRFLEHCDQDRLSLPEPNGTP